LLKIQNAIRSANSGCFSKHQAQATSPLKPEKCYMKLRNTKCNKNSISGYCSNHQVQATSPLKASNNKKKRYAEGRKPSRLFEADPWEMEGSMSCGNDG
jgi:hypothetical protein